MVALERVTCAFPGVRALDDVSLQFRPKEVHALAGENGAGKSTVLRILSGLARPTSGHVRVGSQRFSHLNNSHRLGIRVVPQEPVLVPDLSVAENVLLGNLPRTRFGTVDWHEVDRRAQELLTLVGLETLNPRQPASNLSTSQMQMVQVARALSDGGDTFLFDEPSSSLSPQEFAKLASVIGHLRDQGKVVIYVSHRMSEVFSLCNRVSVLRDGKLMGTLNTSATSPEEVIRLMIGRDLDVPGMRSRAWTADDVALQVGLPGEVALNLRRGEIVGLGGLVGAGRTELLESIFRKRRETDVNIALVPEDRQHTGLALDLSIADNLALTNLRMLSRFGVLSLNKKASFAEKWIGELGIRCQSARQSARYLSGGNQQKIVLAKWLARQPRVLLLDEPTRGIDIAAKAEIHRILRRLADRGTAILMASSDMPELLALSDRILVMCLGRVVSELGPLEMSEEAILNSATPAYVV
jgi:ABC-type sugar transport system ATPase subunit